MLDERRCKYNTPEKWRTEPIHIYIDGSCLGQYCCGAMVVVGHQRNVFVKEFETSEGDCYHAEWQAMLWFARYISHVKPKSVVAYGDNETVINRLTGKIGCKRKRDAKLIKEFDSYIPDHTQLELRWVGRANNLAGIILEWGQIGTKFSKKVKELYPHKDVVRYIKPLLRA